MFPKIFILLLLVTFSIGSAIGQPVNRAKLDSLFDVLSSNNKAMASVAISKNGRMLYTRSIGYNSLKDGKVVATEKTRYRIGSISKMFTATMVFQFVEEGKLSLATTLDKYFPELPNAASITIGNMLNHRSGLHNFTDDTAYMEWMIQPKSKSEMIAIIKKGGSDFQPGTQAAYSNSNYVVLSFILENISGKPYKELLKERITKRIGLANTYYGGKTDVKNNESYSYKYIDNWVQQPETDMSIPMGAGAIVSTPADLTKFIEALFAGKLISAGSLAQMKTITDGYGMGMFQFPFNEKKSYGHTGGIDGFASILSYFPEHHVAVAYCTNGQVYAMNDILIGVLSIYFDQPYTIPTFKTINVAATDLDKYLGTYSSSDMSLKITVTKDNTTLFAQATGQSAFPLEAVEKDKFQFATAGIVMEFNTDKNEMTLKQGGGIFKFIMEK